MTTKSTLVLRQTDLVKLILIVVPKEESLNTSAEVE